MKIRSQKLTSIRSPWWRQSIPLLALLLIPQSAFAQATHQASQQAADSTSETTTAATNRNVTLISTSDSHYVIPAHENQERNPANRQTMEAINKITDVRWPQSLGGDLIEAPRGVLLLGDVIDDGDKMVDGQNASQQQFDLFLSDFGFDGTDGVLKYPVFETWGNHDGPPIGTEKHGFSFQKHLKERNARRLQAGMVKSLSDNGLHCSWDWDDVHFVALGIYPADKQNENVRYNRNWHDPQGALSFLRKDLAEQVGDSGRPVICMAHCGMDTDWWNHEDWTNFYNVVIPYNLAAYVYGHSGTGIRQWAPENGMKPILCINDGQTENGFFVIQLRGDQMRYGFYGKQWINKTDADGKNIMIHGRHVRKFSGQWAWRFTGTTDLKPVTAKIEVE